jgi:hypothetical protein
MLNSGIFYKIRVNPYNSRHPCAVKEMEDGWLFRSWIVLIIMQSLKDISYWNKSI